MPTPPPLPIEPPKDEAEAKQRKACVKLIHTIVGNFNAYAYGTRTHMPHGKDYSDSTDAWMNLCDFASSRPDWTADVVMQALKEMAES